MIHLKNGKGEYTFLVLGIEEISLSIVILNENAPSPPAA